MGIQSPSIYNAPLRIGYSISLSGPLGANGKSAWLAHKLWEVVASPTTHIPSADTENN